MGVSERHETSTLLHAQIYANVANGVPMCRDTLWCWKSTGEYYVCITIRSTFPHCVNNPNEYSVIHIVINHYYYDNQQPQAGDSSVS